MTAEQIMDKKYNILIDLDRLKNINTGLGQVALNFAMHLSQVDDPFLKFTFLVPKKYNGFFGSSVDYENVSLRRRYFPALCREYHLWHSIHQDSAYFPSNKCTPYLLTIHDLNFLGEKTPAKAVKRLRRLQRKIDRARLVTSISNFTADEISKHLELRGTQVETIYNGVEVRSFLNCSRPNFVDEGKELLFSIGVIQPKKNTKVLIGFMKHLPVKYQLVIAGDKSAKYAQEIEQEIKELGLEDRIVMPGQISDEDKYWMLNHAKAILFPSKFEGMGIPPIEAMRCGKPVFASTYSSIPEICQDMAYYWTDFNPKEMSVLFLDKMGEFEQDPDRSRLLKEYAMQFDWSKNVRSYIRLYYRLLGLNLPGNP